MLKEVQDTVFMATDGTKFIDKEEAFDYDCKIEAQNWLDSKKIGKKITIRCDTPFDSNFIDCEIYKIESLEEYNKFYNNIDDIYNISVIDPEDEYRVSHSGYNEKCQYYIYYPFYTLLYKYCIFITPLSNVVNDYKNRYKEVEKIIKKLNKKGKKDWLTYGY